MLGGRPQSLLDSSVSCGMGSTLNMYGQLKKLLGLYMLKKKALRVLIKSFLLTSLTRNCLQSEVLFELTA